MNEQSSPYATPSSELAQAKEDKLGNFSTLNFWRKLYLIILWLATVGICGLMLIGAIQPEASGVGIIAALIICFVAGMSLWTHIAVVRRSEANIIAILVINIVPFFNLIGALIMLSILRTTKKERSQYNIVKT